MNHSSRWAKESRSKRMNVAQSGSCTTTHPPLHTTDKVIHFLRITSADKVYISLSAMHSTYARAASSDFEPVKLSPKVKPALSKPRSYEPTGVSMRTERHRAHALQALLTKSFPSIGIGALIPTHETASCVNSREVPFVANSSPGISFPP